MNKKSWFVSLLLACLASALAGNASSQTVEYIHTDSLGTPVVVTDAAKNVIERSEYSPYGDLLNRNNEDSIGYAGQPQDAATGLAYMQQRYYDPNLGVFLSVDPEGVSREAARNSNRYNYASNNPYTFIDPNGRQVAGSPNDLDHPVTSEQSEQIITWTSNVIQAIDQIVQAYPQGVYEAPVAEGLIGGLDAMAAELRASSGAGTALAASTGVSEDAVFAQRTFSSAFGSEGPLAGRTVEGVSSALQSGEMVVADVPVNYIVRNGTTIILNTRSSQALEMAGIQRSQWLGIDRTGQGLYEKLLDGQLAKNPNGPFSSVRPSGGFSP